MSEPCPVSYASARRRDGFTLIELMVVVVIVGVLAAIAIPAFTKFIYRARAAEAPAFLQEIRARESAYRIDNGQFAAAPANPSSMPTNSDMVQFNRTDASWVQLGALPDAPGVRFQYTVTAGLPGTTPAGGFGYDGTDFWFLARAVGDLDGDGTNVTFEAYSPASHIYCSSANGYE